MLRKFIRSHSAFMAVSAAVVIFMTSLFIYDRLQTRNSIVNLEKIIFEERVARKCSESEARLAFKIEAIHNFAIAKNLQIISDILASYEVALTLAQKGDIRCVMMEEMGDAILRAYKAGVKDAEKNFNFRGV